MFALQRKARGAPLQEPAAGWMCVAGMQAQTPRENYASRYAPDSSPDDMERLLPRGPRQMLTEATAIRRSSLELIAADV